MRGVRVLSSHMIAIELPNHTMQQHATRTPKASSVLPPLCAMRWLLRELGRATAQVWGCNARTSWHVAEQTDRQTDRQAGKDKAGCGNDTCGPYLHRIISRAG